MSKIEQLEKLVSLRDRGALTQEEFDAEKSALLRSSPAADAPPNEAVAALEQPVTSAVSTTAQTSPNTTRFSREEQNELALSFAPIRSHAVALFLLKLAYVSGGLVIFDVLVDIPLHLVDVANGVQINPPVPNATFLQFNIAAAAVVTLIVSVLMLTTVKHRSRIAAIILLLMCSLEFAVSLTGRWDHRNAKVAVIVFGAIALLFCIQAIRAAFVLRGPLDPSRAAKSGLVG